MKTKSASSEVSRDSAKSDATDEGSASSKNYNEAMDQDLEKEVMVEGEHSQAMQIDPKRSRFPCCIVWTPLPVLSWFIPFIGHIGICREDGVILDFAGPNYVCVDHFSFGSATRYLQLGVTNMVYPGAVHSRFEFSLGVYWLAGEAVHQLRSNQGMELDIDHFDIQSVKLAGLLHDVGHGPFSHMFERELLPRILHHTNWSHEDMSVRMIDYIVDEHHIDMDDGILKKAKK